MSSLCVSGRFDTIPLFDCNDSLLRKVETLPSKTPGNFRPRLVPDPERRLVAVGEYPTSPRVHSPSAVNIYDFDSKSPVVSIRGHTSFIWDQICVPSNSSSSAPRIISADNDERILISDSSTGTVLHRLSNCPQAIRVVSWPNSPNEVFVGGQAGALVRYDMTRDGAVVGKISDIPETLNVYGMCTSPGLDALFCALSCHNGEVRMYSHQSLTCEFTIDTGKTNSFCCVVVEESNLLFVGLLDGSFGVWDLRDMSVKLGRVPAHQGMCAYDVVVCGERFVSGSFEGSLSLWKFDQGEGNGEVLSLENLGGCIYGVCVV